MPQDLPLFLGQLIRQPHKVVALAPSSEALARKMALAVPPGDGPIIELGAGTGKITSALLESGIAESDLHAFELSDEFVDHLQDHFEGVNIHHAPAQHMGKLGLKGARAVVSGLPLLSMPNKIQFSILKATRAALAQNGVFVQFTYGHTPPVAERLRNTFGLTWTRSQIVWGNLPPARVYTFRFRQH
ncbi:MAG: methyltransferase type 12 [Pseudomonadota bacterium]